MNQGTFNLANSIRGILALGSAAVGMTMGGSALAQSTGNTAPPMAAGFEEVIVTARRDAEALSRVPLAISALSEKDLAESNITTQSDLQRGVPGLVIRSGQTDNDLTFTIRGQGIDTFSGSRPAVLAYFNEVPLTSLSATNFYDLESIQVLKGPQGTLFGRNTTGGAILYTSAMPTNELEGSITGELGNYNSQKIQAVFNVPLSDVARLRIAGSGQWRDGWQENVFTGQDQGEVDRKSIRATLQLQPSDAFESTTLFSYSHAGGSAVGLNPYSIYDCGATNNGVPLGTIAACTYGPNGALGAAGYDIYHQATPGTSPEGITSLVPEQRELGMRKVSSPLKNYHNSDDWLAINTSSYEINDDLSFKNIISYSRSRSSDLYDSFGTGPYAIGWLYSTLERQKGVPEGFSRDNKSYTWEPQISGSALSGDLTYIVGSFFSREEQYYGAPFKFFDVRPVAPPQLTFNEYEYTDEAQAVYAQSSWDLSELVTDGLKITAGARYTWEQVELEKGSLSTFAGADNEKTHFQDPSWTIGLDYQLNYSWMLYIANRGSFRAGGFNGTGEYKNAEAAQGGNLFLPEHVHDIEIGAKFAGTIGDMPARASIAIYDSKITDVQRTLYTFIPASASLNGADTLATVTVNVPTAKISGVELDGAIDLTADLQIGGSISYTDARYTSGRSEAFGTVYDYGPYADTPEWAGNVFVKVTLPVPAEIGEMSFRSDVYAQTEQYFSNLNDTVAPDTKLAGYGIVNATASWNGIMGSSLDGTLFIKNAFQKEYYTGGFGFPPLGTNSAMPAEPRTYGVSLSHKF